MCVCAGGGSTTIKKYTVYILQLIQVLHLHYNETGEFWIIMMAL